MVSLPGSESKEPVSSDGLIDVEGVSAGHWTDPEARTGCTVLLFDRPALAAVDVRGAAPGTRETDLLQPDRLVRRVDALLLTGGSAFGLAAADGVVRFLAERGRGFPTPAGPVPIVPAAVIYDLGVGTLTAPGNADGYAACQAAAPIPALSRGQVGAGCGATTSKMRSPVKPGGIGIGQVLWKEGSVTAIAVVNAFGAVVDPAQAPVPDVEAHRVADPRLDIIAGGQVAGRLGQSTTLGVIVVDSPADHPTLMRCTIAAHDSLARCIRPCHTLYDGDLVFAATIREGSPEAIESLRISLAAEVAMERAILDAMPAAGASSSRASHAAE